MGGDQCSTCHRRNGSPDPLTEPSEVRAVSLRSLDGSALTCEICAFVQEVLSLDPTTPEKTDESYESSTLKVEDGGLRFTGQWQGALVIEIYKNGRHHVLNCGST